jgi:two-component system, sensor histidine kinase and response regulator
VTIIDRSKALEDPRQSAAHRARVLVVEDDLMLRKVIVKVLEKLGYACETANDGVEALAAHEKRAFDVILMDCQMPRLDGFKATSAIRKREIATRQHVPIIALTAMLGTRAQCLEAGMDDYMNKPLQPAAIDEAIQRALSSGTDRARL